MLLNISVDAWVTALATIMSAIISSCISYAIYRFGFKRDLEKLRLSWNREDKLAYMNQFTKMVTSVSEYLTVEGAPPHSAAMNSVRALQATESGTNAQMLDDLYNAISEHDKETTRNILSQILQGDGFTKSCP